ncbi:MAG TPA: hypothetical protein VNX28_05520, partial [Gemmataceae bacterium]|nr:hypothetical protein [Gemmataceae bacterium]
MSEYAKPALDAMQGLLGYVNFSAGKPDARFQKQLNDVYAALASQGSARPWQDLCTALQDGLKELQETRSAAFREADQAQAVLGLVFEH